MLSKNTRNKTLIMLLTLQSFLIISFSHGIPNEFIYNINIQDIKATVTNSDIFTKSLLLDTLKSANYQLAYGSNHNFDAFDNITSDNVSTPFNMEETYTNQVGFVKVINNSVLTGSNTEDDGKNSQLDIKSDLENNTSLASKILNNSSMNPQTVLNKPSKDVSHFNYSNSPVATKSINDSGSNNFFSYNAFYRVNESMSYNKNNTNSIELQSSGEVIENNNSNSTKQRGEYLVDDNGIHYYNINNCSEEKGSSGIGNLSECEDAERELREER